MNSVAIIGAGHVGKGMQTIFPDALMIDPPQGLGLIEDAADCVLAIVCVPTPMLPDGACDTSIVSEVVEGLASDLILIKSTVEPGTTERLREKSGKRIVFSPEYMGESKYWTPPEYPDPRSPISHGFMILGGSAEDCSAVADMFLPVLGPATRFRFMSSTEAELVKYAENSFFALKVIFANELRRICELTGANYHYVRERWLADPRVGPMHTAAFKRAPGFGGKCLPKDINALAALFRRHRADSKLLDAVIHVNENMDLEKGNLPE